ncbi:MAG TPA: MEDS domain-containing protein [Xanthomonadales bacterium]|nr:MEDS domain-containing protein [Xanthomonadales bacterium]
MSPADAGPGYAEAPHDGEHLLHFYHDAARFESRLADFVASGLAGGEVVIAIATTARLASLDDELRRRDVDVGAMLLQGRYQPLDAGVALETFMRDGRPDARSFLELLTGLLRRARREGRRVRAFGEMVALLWARNERAATLRLEHLWHAVCRRERLLLLCAYPHGCFHAEHEARAAIAAAHTREVAATA